MRQSPDQTPYEPTPHKLLTSFLKRSAPGDVQHAEPQVLGHDATGPIERQSPQNPRQPSLFIDFFLYLRSMKITLPSLDQLPEAAERFIDTAQLVQHPGRVFAFYGKMGVVKTTFIKALCTALDVEDVVNSPTFSIVNEYESPRLNGSVFHFDFYRIKDIQEAQDIGTDDYFYSGHPCFIEWPELIEPLLPEDAVVITLEEQPDGSRTLTCNL